jgi:WD40 repeat protein
MLRNPGHDDVGSTGVRPGDDAPDHWRVGSTRVRIITLIHTRAIIGVVGHMLEWKEVQDMTLGSDTSTQEKARYSFDQFTAIRRYQDALAFSPDGSEIAYSVDTSGQFNLWRQSSDGGYPHQLTLSNEQAVREISWSPDGSTLLYTADHDGDEFTHVFAMSASGGQPVQITSPGQALPG